MTAPFHGRRILVTGAAKGIGLATLARLAAEGASVAALDRDARALAALPGGLGPALGHLVAVDVADPAAAADAVKASAETLGGLDGVVNAAGVDLYAGIEAMASADWDRVIAVNLTAPFLVIRAAYSFLKAAGGGAFAAQEPHSLLRLEGRLADGVEGARHRSGRVWRPGQHDLSGRGGGGALSLELRLGLP